MVKSIAALLVSCGLLAGPAWTACRADDTPRKAALLVGVNRYLKPGFDDLRFAEADVIAVGAELESLGFEVTVLLGSGEEDQQATRANILAAARRMVAPLGKRDVALIMLSGHGQTLNPDPKADPNSLDVGQFESYYCAVDSRFNDPASQVSLNYLLDEVLARDVGRKLLVLDACRDIPIDRSIGGRNSRGVSADAISIRTGTSVYLSCGFGQRSFEQPEVGHGLFTYCLLEGLRGKAAREGELAWADLVAHVNRQMRSPEILKLMPENEKQVPFPAGDLTDTVLGRLDMRPRVTTSMPRPMAPTNPRPSPSTRTSESLEGKQAGEVRLFTELEVKFCWCPAGSFTMGSPASEADRFDNESQVSVTLSRGFWLGQTEVTQGLWQSVMGTTPWVGQKVGSQAWHREGPDYPAVYVNWDDVTEFCRKLTAREREAGRLPSGWSYQLPTEAQWEYACRAGTTGPYNRDGAGVLSDSAWYDKNALNVGEMYAHLVGQKTPNRWGLYDMHGNVWEWVQDWSGDRLPGGRDPLVSTGGSLRVLRSGGWSNPAGSCRSAHSGGSEPTYRDYDLGFRCALSPTRE